ncbi:MAG: elongation factor G [Spirochaetes bacterium]|nr:elongation factor G [Spirochaetota bacterium]
MQENISQIRNIGISAHIDSGKTTLTERILFYCKKIHAIHEVKDKDGKGATMDSMELERERGITIASAATNVEWKDHSINIIDTPGHVDFTIEVERALRVLDGAVLVLCAVGGVQSQSITVDRQLKRYGVPRIAFINKCDRTGANPYRVAQQLREKLGLNAVMLQLPIGLEDKLQGVIDLVTMKAVYFEGENGDIIREAEIPSELMEEARKKHEELIDAVTMVSDELSEAYLEDKITEELINKAIREATISLQLVPVAVGSAYKNKGVQSLMDMVINYLPDPTEIKNFALDLDDNENEVLLIADVEKPTVALAFKLEEGQYGQLTYVRIYQGSISKGDELYNTRSKRKFKVGRLIRMHADKMEDISYGRCGDIVAIFGIDCASGDTFVNPKLNYSMTTMFVPEPVISLAIKPKDQKSSANLAKALSRFIKEDPTFQTYTDEESGERIIKGMGELHLDVYIERMKREYDVAVDVGMPEVAYREAITETVTFDYTHKKQTGGAGQFARIAGQIEPTSDAPYEFVDQIKGGVIPNEFIPSCDKGFHEALKKGTLVGYPITGVKVTLLDGDFHPVDSSTMAFQTASTAAFRQVYSKAKPQLLEPIMKVSVEGPSEFQGNVFSSINQRRGMIVSTTEDDVLCRVEAEVPLSEMFGYSTDLRSMTQGKSEFTMEFLKYSKVPESISEKIKKEIEEKKNKKGK